MPLPVSHADDEDELLPRATKRRGASLCLPISAGSGAKSARWLTAKWTAYGMKAGGHGSTTIRDFGRERHAADLPPAVGPLIVRVPGLYPVPAARRREP